MSNPSNGKQLIIRSKYKYKFALNWLTAQQWGRPRELFLVWVAVCSVERAAAGLGRRQQVGGPGGTRGTGQRGRGTNHRAGGPGAKIQQGEM